jgi:hypothetical protein
MELPVKMLPTFSKRKIGNFEFFRAYPKIQEFAIVDIILGFKAATGRFRVGDKLAPPIDAAYNLLLAETQPIVGQLLRV